MPEQVPPEQTSPVVHLLSSSQISVLFENTHMPWGRQMSFVQASLSSQSEWALHGTQCQSCMGSFVHPCWTSQESMVQAFWSSQLGLMSMWVQPLARSQPSSVQALPSSQSAADVSTPAQVP